MTKRVRFTAWIFTFGGPLLYLLLAIHMTVAAQQSRSADIPRENQINIQNLTHRVDVLEAMHLERDISILMQSSQVLQDKLNTMLGVGMVLIGGIILNLGLSVFRLTVQIKSQANT